MQKVTSKQQEVAIIGAGFTGLVAALRLAQADCKVTIYERSDTIGGLAAGFRLHGTSLEKAYHHIFRTDTDIINLAHELELDDKLTWNQSSIAIYYNKRIYPFMTPMDLLKFTPLTVFNRIRAGLVVFYLQKSTAWRNLLPKTAYGWMLKWSGKRVTAIIWEPLLKGKFDHYYDKVSMAWLWARIHVRANSRLPGESVEKLGYFDGGFQVVVSALEKTLCAAGVDIACEVTVSNIASAAKGATLKVDGKKKRFDSIIATTPTHIFTKLAQGSLSKKYIEKLNSIDYLGAICLVFSSKQDIGNSYWLNINDISIPFLVFINHTKLIDRKKYDNKYVYYIGKYVPHDHAYYTMPDDELAQEWFVSLKKIFPEFKQSALVKQYLFRFKYAQHIVDTKYDQKIPAYQTPIKNVYLANFTQVFPEDRGTNFAVREGNKIAAMIIQKDSK